MATPSNTSPADDANVPLSSPSTTTTLISYPGTFHRPIYDTAEWAISDKPTAFCKDGSTTDDMSDIRSVKIIWPTIPPLSGFAALPNELQAEIARFALPAPQIIFIHQEHFREIYSIDLAYSRILAGKFQPLDFISVSTGFRDVFWKNYKWLALHGPLPIWGSMLEADSNLPKVLLDPNRDTVVLDIDNAVQPGEWPNYMEWLELPDLKHLGIQWRWSEFDVPYGTALPSPLGIVLPWEIAVKFPKLSTLTVILGATPIENQRADEGNADCQFFDIDTQLADVITNRMLNCCTPEIYRQVLEEDLEVLSRVAARVRESFNEAINTQPALQFLKNVQLKIVITAQLDNPSVKPILNSTLHVVPKNPIYHGVRFSMEKPGQSLKGPSWLLFDQLHIGHAASVREDGTLASNLDSVEDTRYLWD